MLLGAQRNNGGHSHRDAIVRYVLDHHRIGSNQDVFTDSNTSENFCACTDVNMSTNSGQTITMLSNGDLLKNKAVGSYY